MAKTTATRLVGASLGLLLSTFGSYILYEKVSLAIADGHSHERAGVVARAEEPFSFWLGIFTYDICSSFIAIAGLS